MRILLLASKEEDYLQDSIIHGFKQLFGKDAVEYPVKHILYNDHKNIASVRGNGFTLYGLLDSDLKPKEEIDIEEALKANKFNLVVFTSIYRQYEIFYRYFEVLKKAAAQTWIMDGEDTPILFPYLGKHIKKFLFSSKPHRNFLYFKRELLPGTLNSIYFRLPVSLIQKLAFPENIKPISFSIPQEKIIHDQPVKTKLFTQHIVDKDVAEQLYGTANISLFDSEGDYYNDIQHSKFAITTKRAGWDCLRHYEIAANGAVICFKDLDKKPVSCAPHGLVDHENCIAYADYSDLTNKINKLPGSDYENILAAGLRWANANSTIACVTRLINNYYRTDG